MKKIFSVVSVVLPLTLFGCGGGGGGASNEGEPPQRIAAPLEWGSGAWGETTKWGSSSD